MHFTVIAQVPHLRGRYCCHLLQVGEKQTEMSQAWLYRHDRGARIQIWICVALSITELFLVQNHSQTILDLLVWDELPANE